MKLRGILGGLTAALMLAVPAAAQGPGPMSSPMTEQLQHDPDEGTAGAQYAAPPGPGGMMPHHGPGMGGHHAMRDGMWRAPLTMMLRHRDELGLSAPQVQGLEQLRRDFMREAIRRDADRKIARLDLFALLRPDPADPTKPVDMAKVEAKIREIEKMRADLQLARIRTIEAGKAQLTPEQRTKLAALVAQLRGRWQRDGPPSPRPMPPPPRS